MKTIGYAVVGTGYFGAELARIMKEQEGARVVAVYDPENAGTVAAELGCDTETDLDRLYSREDVDAVIVASPNYLHKEPVIKAAEHGVHVFCEKPIALSYQDCVEMVEACVAHNVTFMAGHVMNFFKGVRTAKKMINDGVIGKVLYCHSARNGWEDIQPSVSWKKIRAKSGGHLYHHIHELDCIQFLMGGCPEEVTMAGGNVAHCGEQFGDEDDMLFITMEYGDNRYAVLEYGSAFHWPEHYVLIQGTEGAIRLDMFNCGGTLKKGDKEEPFLMHKPRRRMMTAPESITARKWTAPSCTANPGKSLLCGFTASCMMRWSTLTISCMAPSRTRSLRPCLQGRLPGTPLPRQTPAPGPGLRTER